MITNKRVDVDAPEETRKNRSKKVKKFNAYDRRDRSKTKQSLRKSY